jgi:phage-related minor tail protein
VCSSDLLAYKRSDTFRNAVNALGRALSTVLGAAIRAVSSAISGLVGWLRTAWDWLSRMIAKVGELAGKLNPLKSLGRIVGLGASAATYTTTTVAPTGYRAAAYTTPLTQTAAPMAAPTDEQLYRAVWRLLERGNARNGRPGWAGA